MVFPDKSPLRNNRRQANSNRHGDLILRNGGHEGQKHIITFSEITMYILFRFGMEVHLGHIYQVCTNEVTVTYFGGFMDVQSC